MESEKARVLLFNALAVLSYATLLFINTETKDQIVFATSSILFLIIGNPRGGN